MSHLPGVKNHTVFLGLHGWPGLRGAIRKSGGLRTASCVLELALPSLACDLRGPPAWPFQRAFVWSLSSDVQEPACNSP